MNGAPDPRDPAAAAILFRDARHGDRAAFGALARTWTPSVYRIAFATVRDRELARRVTLQTLSLAGRTIRRAPPGPGFEVWILRLARARALAAHHGEAGAAAAAAGGDGPFDRAAAAFASLTPEHRHALTLRLVERMDYVAIAKALDVAPALALARVAGARRNLLARTGGPEPDDEGGHLAMPQLCAALDAELRGPALEEVERHLAACPSCDAVLDRLVRLDAELLRVVTDDPGPGFFDRMIEEVSGQPDEAAAPRPFRPPVPWGPAPGTEPAPGATAAEPAAPVQDSAIPLEALTAATVEAPAARRIRRRSWWPAPHSRLGRAWIAAAGALVIPMVGLIGLGALNAERTRDLRRATRLPARVAGPAAAALAASPEAAPAPAAVAAPPASHPPRPAPAVAPAPKPDAPAPAAPVRAAVTEAPAPPVGAGPAAAPGPPGLLCGEVRDGGGRPVGAARIEAGGLAWLTDGDGRFCVALPRGAHRLAVSAPGFPSQTVEVSVSAHTADVMVTLGR